MAFLCEHCGKNRARRDAVEEQQASLIHDRAAFLLASIAACMPSRGLFRTGTPKSLSCCCAGAIEPCDNTTTSTR
jgi:hypothetical protein